MFSGAGAPVDIVTGRPLAAEPETRAEAESAAAEELARVIAGSVSESRAAEQVVALIQDALGERIEKILRDDPQAIAYGEILKKLGAARITGEIAAREFVRRRQLRPWKAAAV